MGIGNSLRNLEASAGVAAQRHTADNTAATAKALTDVLTELRTLNAQVAWQNQAIAAAFAQWGVPLPR